MSTPDISKWEVESLRFTVLTQQLISSERNVWWDVVAGKSPEVSTTRQQIGEHIDQWELSDGSRLELRTLPSRIDWLYFPKENTSYVDANSYFLQKMKSWLLDTQYICSRVAFGVVIMESVSDKVSGYRLLGQFLPFVDMDIINWNDFLLQLNRPIEYPVDTGNSMKINQLAKYTTIEQRVFQINSVGVPQSVEKGKFKCRIELDINTDAEYQHDIATTTVVNLLEQFMKINSAL